MNFSTRIVLCTAGLMISGTCVAEHAPPLSHTVVYRESGRFGGWPANHGIWIWGNEIVG